MVHTSNARYYKVNEFVRNKSIQERRNKKEFKVAMKKPLLLAHLIVARSVVTDYDCFRSDKPLAPSLYTVKRLMAKIVKSMNTSRQPQVLIKIFATAPRK